MKHWQPTLVAKPTRPIADVRMGEMLLIAIRHGALLARGWWEPWIVAVQRGVQFDGARLWVDMAPADGINLPARHRRRWFADPITRALILKWHRDGLVCAPDTTPAACLAAYLDRDQLAESDLDDLVTAAEAHWKLRIPGLLVAHAAGRITTASLPARTWGEIAFDRVAADVVEHRAEDAIDAGGMMPAVAEPAEPGSPTGRVRSVSAALKDHKKQPRGMPASTWKANARRAVRSIATPKQKIAKELRDWCLWALRNEGGRASKGFAVSTTQSYLGKLNRIFSAWEDSTFTSADAADVRALLIGHLDRCIGCPPQNTLKAMLSYARYMARDKPGSTTELLEEIGQRFPEGHGAADLVTPTVYAKALALLGRGPFDEDATLFLVLAFRTGARPDEILALRRDDFSEGKGHLDMVIDANASRSLKTKTSRRVIPAEVLLEEDELVRLKKRLLERATKDDLIGERWLFGSPDGVIHDRNEAVTERVAEVLRAVSGSKRLGLNHLRHSCASYLLATLLLPLDVPHPSIPVALQSVVSVDRRDQISRRLLGAERLGGGAMHAVSQMLGHTAPGTSLLYYCHLLDFSLLLYITRPSSMRSIDVAWLCSSLGYKRDTLRKARSRAQADLSKPNDTEQAPLPIRRHRQDRAIPIYSRPSATAISAGLNREDELRVVSDLLDRDARRLGREFLRRSGGPVMSAADQLARPQEPIIHDNGRAGWKLVRQRDRRLLPGERMDRGYRVPWRTIIGAIQGTGIIPSEVGAADVARWRRGKDLLDLAGEMPAGLALQALVEQRLSLSRPIRDAERRALEGVLSRWRRGAVDVRLMRLEDARAFITLLEIMGFKDDDITLRLTSKKAADMSAESVRRFLAKPQASSDLYGRWGWRGSLVVQFRLPEFGAVAAPAHAVRFALVVLGIDAGLIV